MGKVLYTYGGFTAQDLKNRASIPSQADITVGANYIDCSSVDIPSEIRDVIGEGSNDLGTIYCSEKVNKWSGFGPREWYVSAGSFFNRIKSNPCDMSNFCGYNHNAIIPGFMGGSHITTFKYISNDANPYTISVGLQVGEINFPSMVAATHVKLVVRESGSVVGSGLIAIGTAYNGTTPINPYYNLTIGSRTGTRTFATSVYLSNAAGDELCLFPNVATWNIIATQRMPPAAAAMPSPSDSTIIKIVAATCTVDLAGNYTISISNLTRWNMTPYTGNINIRSELYNDAGTLIASNASIVTNSSLRSFSGNIGRATDYDYLVKFIITGY